MGSGTMANDVIAAQLSLSPGKGLVLSNGEFGDRLLDHARRMGLAFESLTVEWGRAFDLGMIEAALTRNPGTEWLWAVHCETSTGVLNDLGAIKEACAVRDIRLAMDCISSIGTVPVDLRGVHFASCVSGKGLGAYPGLSMVYYENEVEPAPDILPRYLDLGLYAAKHSVPFTLSSNLLYGLDAALDVFQSNSVFDEIADISASLRRGLRRLGYRTVAPEEHSSPAVLTIELPEEVRSIDVGLWLEAMGYVLSYNSSYLLVRNWIQVCLMGEISREAIASLVDLMGKMHLAGSR